MQIDHRNDKIFGRNFNRQLWHSTTKNFSYSPRDPFGNHLSEQFLKEKYGLTGRKVLTTFGLLSSGKSIETTIKALPAIVAAIPEVIFLIIGKTHPEVVKEEGEKYRESLIAKSRSVIAAGSCSFYQSAFCRLLSCLNICN
jgi:hypothetical protein